jgi:hypothetical protein
MLVCSCAAQVSTHPPASDLIVEPKPQPADAIATSQQAYDLYQADIEAWGDREHDQLARLCRWNESVYKLRLNCPKP